MFNVLSISNLRVVEVQDDCVSIAWDPCDDAVCYRVYWSDKDTQTMVYRCVGETETTSFCLKKATHVPHYLKVSAIKDDVIGEQSHYIKTPVHKVFHEQLEKLSRGLIAFKTNNGVFLSWRLMLDEVTGNSKKGMTGVDFIVYKNGEKKALVTESTNYLDTLGTLKDRYCVAGLDIEGKEAEKCKEVCPGASKDGYLEIPMQIPEGGRTPAGEDYFYQVNDMSVGDVDGDGEYEYIVKWDPSNSHDVSHMGYTGKCYIDCYKLNGRLLWRLDMGVNIRAGAHYTQFMVYDFDGDGKAEISVKSAPGTKMTIYGENGSILSQGYITLPEQIIAAGVTNDDNYVCSKESYKAHLIDMFMGWHLHEEVVKGNWPQTFEACFGIATKYDYPLSREDATELVDYFINVYAKIRSEKNRLDAFEGFIYEGPEFLTMFSGEGHELETIPFKFGREDDGLKWGDYAMKRIEPCNRVDRFLSGVAYLDGEHPYLIIARGYYTRTTLVAYRFIAGHHEEYFSIDSGHVPMENPFNDNAHIKKGSDLIYGILAGQGNHSLSTADVDGDGYQEIIYGAAVIDHDGSILYSSDGNLPDGRKAKLGHGDAMQVARIDPDRPGLQIFNVFEGAKEAPYGFALRDAETGEVLFGEYAESDLGRCMIGDVMPDVRGLQVWVKNLQSCKGMLLSQEAPGTNFSIRWAADMSTQIIDGADYVHGNHVGIIHDYTRGILLYPVGVATNNGTKGTPCLVADIFGDYREELIVRTKDNRAIRIYTNTEITEHKLFTLMHDIQYRTGVAWQNNCYNQPCYTKFYYARDMEWQYVLPQLNG